MDQRTDADLAADAELATLVFLLGRLERLNETLVADVCAVHGVSSSELRVLGALHNGPEPARPSDIGRWVLQTTGGMTSTLRRLERSGRIERVDDPDDGRSRRVRVTPEGTAFYDEVLADLVGRYTVAFTGVDVGSALLAARALIGGLEGVRGAPSSHGWELVGRPGTAPGGSTSDGASGSTQ